MLGKCCSRNAADSCQNSAPNLDRAIDISPVISSRCLRLKNPFRVWQLRSSLYPRNLRVHFEDSRVTVSYTHLYIKEYHELTKKDGIPFVPGAVWKDLVFSAFILLSVAACAVYFGPFGPSGPPNPTIIQTAPRPDFFFLWLYAILSLLPPSMETPALLIGPVVVILGLLLLPFLFGEGEKSWRRRPVAVLTILLVAVALGTFTRLAGNAPWSPVMDLSLIHI